MTTITSRDNPLYKQFLKLAESSRERKKTQRTLIEGIHVVQTYHQALGFPKALVISASGVQNSEIEALVDRCRPLAPTILTDALFHALSALETPVGIIALIETPPPAPVPAHMDCCVVLEGIQDPGNLGSILRSAAAADVKHIVLSKGCVFAWSPRVIRAAMGSHFLLTIHEQQDLISVLGNFNGKKLATGPRATTSLYDVDLRGPFALMIGNEGAGVSPELAMLANMKATIPMPGKMESLNAAAAAAICLFERVRQLRDR